MLELLVTIAFIVVAAFCLSGAIIDTFLQAKMTAPKLFARIVLILFVLWCLSDPLLFRLTACLIVCGVAWFALDWLSEIAFS